MNEFLMSAPQSLVGWISTILILISGIIILFSKIRRDDLETLRASNADLRSSLNDLRIEMDEMKIEIEDLKAKNGTLYEIVSNSLNEYFTNNPEIAREYKHALEMTYVQLKKMADQKKNF